MTMVYPSRIGDCPVPDSSPDLPSPKYTLLLSRPCLDKTSVVNVVMVLYLSHQTRLVFHSDTQIPAPTTDLVRMGCDWEET